MDKGLLKRTLLVSYLVNLGERGLVGGSKHLIRASSGSQIRDPYANTLNPVPTKL